PEHHPPSVQHLASPVPDSRHPCSAAPVHRQDPPAAPRHHPSAARRSPSSSGYGRSAPPSAAPGFLGTLPSPPAAAGRVAVWSAPAPPVPGKTGSVSPARGPRPSALPSSESDCLPLLYPKGLQECGPIRVLRDLLHGRRRGRLQETALLRSRLQQNSRRINHALP